MRIDNSRLGGVVMTPGFMTNPFDLVILALVAFLVLGPKRLPEVARSFGRGLREVRAAFSGPSNHHPDRQATQDGPSSPIEIAYPDPSASPSSAGQSRCDHDKIA